MEDIVSLDSLPKTENLQPNLPSPQPFESPQQQFKAEQPQFVNQNELSGTFPIGEPTNNFQLQTDPCFLAVSSNSNPDSSLVSQSKSVAFKQIQQKPISGQSPPLNNSNSLVTYHVPITTQGQVGFQAQSGFLLGQQIKKPQQQQQKVKITPPKIGPRGSQFVRVPIANEKIQQVRLVSVLFIFQPVSFYIIRCNYNFNLKNFLL